MTAVPSLMIRRPAGEPTFTISGPSGEPTITSDELAVWVRENFVHLRQHEQVLCHLLFFADPPLTRRQAAERLSVSPGRVSQCLAKVYDKMRVAAFYDKMREGLPVPAELPADRRIAVPVQRLTSVAAFLAGRKRGGLHDEWQSHLSGEDGRGLAKKGQLLAACGFIRAALRCRVQDALELAWRPVDAVLRSRILSNLVVGIPLLAAVLAVVRHDGLYGLVANAENLTALVGGAYGTIRLGRWWRGVKPPKHQPRRPDK
jgi:hypothetical protein